MPTEIFDPAPATPLANAATNPSQAGAKRNTTTPEVGGGAADEESHGDEDGSMASASDDDSLKEVTTPSRGGDEETASKADTGTPSSAADGSDMPGKKKANAQKKGRTPAVKGLSIPFRTVKKAMKLDPDIPIVQNEAAIMTTLAAELFLRSLAKESYQIAKTRGRNTIRYEDLAEARSNDPALSFLATLIP